MMQFERTPLRTALIVLLLALSLVVCVTTKANAVVSSGGGVDGGAASAQEQADNLEDDEGFLGIIGALNEAISKWIAGMLKSCIEGILKVFEGSSGFANANFESTLEDMFSGGTGLVYQVLNGTELGESNNNSAAGFGIVEGAVNATKTIAASLLALFMILQVYQIARRMDSGRGTNVVFEVFMIFVYYFLFSWFIDNALEVCRFLNGIANYISRNISMANFGEVHIDDANIATLVAEELTTAGFAAIGSMLITALTAVVATLLMSIAMALIAFGFFIRSIQLWCYATVSPIAASLTCFDHTRQFGIGFFKNYAALAFQIIVYKFLFILYAGSARMFIPTHFDSITQIGVMGLACAGMSIAVLMVSGKAGTWAKEMLG